jgi:hypothetical protein
MEVFAAQAASVVYNAKTWERNNRYFEMRRADSLSLSVSEIVSSLAHKRLRVVDSHQHLTGPVVSEESKTGRRPLRRTA